MMRILIVEDEEHLARLVAEGLGREGDAARGGGHGWGGRGARGRLVAGVLGRGGGAAEVVGNGRAALAWALVEPFDLLVVDWMLPDLDGVQVVRRLRAADVGVPVLMLTARSQVEDRVEGLDAGADDYLS